MDCKEIDRPSKGGYVTGQQIFRQDEGRVVFVNHDRHSTHVWVNDGGFASTVLRADTRPALPTDPGYLATFPEWYALRSKAIGELSRLAFAYAVLACLGLGFSVYLLAKGAQL